MGMIGTFESFTTARLGIYAAQKGLSVTGNNISNLNTAGYTRQVIDQYSFKAGANDMYRSMMDNHVGSGALVTGISQIRDPYLDIRYRNTNSDVGYHDTMLGGLQHIKAVLDEVGKGEDTNNNEKGDGMLYAQLRDIYKSLEQLSLNPSLENDRLVRTSADALVNLFHTYATKLEGLQKETEESFNQDIKEVNDILVNIRNLNKAIRTAEISGDKALEMRDERNRQIDKLSEYMHIKVEYSMEDVGAGIEVEKLTISLNNANPDKSIHTDESVLVDGLYATQLSVPEKMPRLNPAFGDADDPNGIFLYLKADGTGTNDFEELEDGDLVANTNYGIHLDKLLNEQGEEWKDVKVTWDSDVGGSPATKGVYNFILTSTANTADNTVWQVGDDIEIGGQTFTVGQGGLTLAMVQDSGQLAAFIAKELNKTNNDYTVSANGSNIVFRAKTAGAPGGEGPEAPTLTLTNGGNKLALADGPQKPGQDGTKPDGWTADPVTTVDPETGIETTEQYRFINNKWYKMTTVTEYTHETALDHNDLYGSLQAMRELLTGKGEFATTGDNLTDADGNPINSDMTMDEGAAISRGIPYYRMSLDLLARQFATYYNGLNQGYMVNQDGNYIGTDGKELTLAGEAISKTNGLTDDQKDFLIGQGHFTTAPDGTWVADVNDWLAQNGGMKPEGAGNLFSNHDNSDDGDGITAANISVAHSWYTEDVRIVPTHVQLFGEDGKPISNSTQVDNVDHMISLNEQSLYYDPRDLDPNAVGHKLFVGSFNDMYSNMNTILGEDQRTINLQLTAHSTSLVDLDASRDGVSGVDLNDEAMNMMMYQKAYSAACRMMTVIDSVLEQLINNTAV